MGIYIFFVIALVALLSGGTVLHRRKHPSLAPVLDHAHVCPLEVHDPRDGMVMLLQKGEETQFEIHTNSWGQVPPQMMTHAGKTYEHVDTRLGRHLYQLMTVLLFVLSTGVAQAQQAVTVTKVGSGSTAVTVGTEVPVGEADGKNVTLGSKGDAKSSATDSTAISIMQVLKQMSASLQAPPSQAVTNTGTFATQSATTVADGANVTLGAKADAKSTATDTTSISIMQVLKQISASVQAPPSQAVTNAGTFAVTQGTGTNLHMVCDSGCSSSAGFADNSAFTFGTTAINPIGGVFDDVSPNMATENSAAVARITSFKALHVNLRTAAGVEITPSVDATTNTTTQTTGPQLFGNASAASPSDVGADGRSVAVWTTLKGSVHTTCDSGCSGGTTDADDGTIAGGQTTGLNLGLTQVYDGSNWKRLTIGTAGTASAQVMTVQGISSMTKLLVTPDSVALPANQSVNISQANGVTLLMNTGATGTGSPRMTVAVDSATVAGSATLPAGSNSIGTVQPGNTPNTTPWLVQAVPGTASGLTTFVLEAAASDNHTNVKNGAGVVYHITSFNNSATVNYYRLYNAATGFNGCNSATNLLWEGLIPASTSGGGFVEDIGAGITFSTGISICVTGGFGNTSTTNATASAILFNLGYK